MPSASDHELDWFNDFRRRNVGPENAVRFLTAFSEIDVPERLGHVKCPTLVRHARDDQRVPVALGIDLAARNPGASLVALDTDNHIPLSRQPATARIAKCTEAFLRGR